MGKQIGAGVFDTPSQSARAALVEQILWLISLRWVAAGCIVLAALIGRYVYPVLSGALPIYICAGVLVLSNVLYLLVARRDATRSSARDVALGMAQAEVDLVILTAVLHFSGGVVNPFFLFYVFQVIVATIILPRHLSFVVGLTAILLFGLLVVNELHGGALLGRYPLQLAAGRGLWRNPVYALAAFVAFTCTVVFAQYLTRMIIVRMASKELEAARKGDLLAAVIEAMGEGLAFVTCDGKVAICNRAANAWKEPDSFSGSNGWLAGFPPALVAHVRSLIEHDNGPEPSDRKMAFRTTGPNERFIEAKSHPVIGVDGVGLGYVIVGQDLTEHKKLEAELRQQSEEVATINEMLKMSRIEMAQRERMVAVGQMAAGIAHEIGNPLASLSSVVQYLRRSTTEPKQKELLSTLDHHVRRISDILKRMLALSRPATTECKWADINELIGSTLSLVKFDRRAQAVTIRDITCDDLPMVWLNPQHFEQLLLNIFINALDAMDAKETDQDHVLEVTRSFDGDTVEIHVTDTGVGMSPDVCKRAFESFFTTKEIGRGTGLGLFISYNLAREIDGGIELCSELGKGTTAIIRMPARPKKALITGADGQL